MLSRHLPAAVLLIAMAGCAAVPEVPSAPPPRVAGPAPRPAPPPVVATSSDWRDWPLTPGDWSYRRTGAGTEAMFGASGQALFVLSCGGDRRIGIATPSGTTGAMTIRTTSVARALPAGPVALAANDPLLDAMGFSRGRFVVEQGGARTLVLPSWAEILRVAEDCRG